MPSRTIMTSTNANTPSHAPVLDLSAAASTLAAMSPRIRLDARQHVDHHRQHHDGGRRARGSLPTAACCRPGRRSSRRAPTAPTPTPVPHSTAEPSAMRWVLRRYASVMATIRKASMPSRSVTSSVVSMVRSPSAGVGGNGAAAASGGTLIRMIRIMNAFCPGNARRRPIWPPPGGGVRRSCGTGPRGAAPAVVQRGASRANR